MSEDSHKDPQPQLPGPDPQETLEDSREARMTFTEHLGELRDRYVAEEEHAKKENSNIYLEEVRWRRRTTLAWFG